MADDQRVRRCAIYTRKSSEEGLDQEFNSLHAQQESCAAFVASQKHEGWELIQTFYDDGGYSGGTMERPALQRLLTDIENGQVDVIVVYKVDRLSRALSDFARMVETFDAHDVSFVSVTQQFNTTTSMGRLTLNVLLSFAQFEREVTGERIRDKFAASKKKGLWMGGNVPLGYDIVDRKLVVNQVEAEQVQHIFSRYADIGCVRKLRHELTEQGYRSKVRTSAKGKVSGGNPFSRGALYALLQNPIYLGDIRHKDKQYPGEHDAIIDRELWLPVQARLALNRLDRNTGRNSSEPSPLVGLLFDEHGRRLTPSHSRKGKRKYRYYVTTEATSGSHLPVRVPANDIEKVVRKSLQDLLLNQNSLIQLLELANDDVMDQQFLFDQAQLRSTALEGSTNGAFKIILNNFISRIDLYRQSLRLSMSPQGLRAWLGDENDDSDRMSDRPVYYEVDIAVRRRGCETKLVLECENSQPDTNYDTALIKAIAQAQHWREQLLSGDVRSLREIASRLGVNDRYISRRVKLAYLAPDIVESILKGTQPIDLTLDRLEHGYSPDWSKQRSDLGMRQIA